MKKRLRGNADGLTLWRISSFVDLDGFGGMEFSGRWHTAGCRIVYLADSPTGALVETLVHLQVDTDEVPPNFKLLEITAPQDVSLGSAEALEAFWENDLLPTRRIGDEWLQAGKTALLKVPSALVPRAFNYLLNPLHPEAHLFQIKEVLDGRYDSRLFRNDWR